MVQYPPWIDQLGKYYQTKCNLFCSGNLANIPQSSHIISIPQDICLYSYLQGEHDGGKTMVKGTLSRDF
jgi:hypothetical protein